MKLIDIKSPVKVMIFQARRGRARRTRNEIQERAPPALEVRSGQADREPVAVYREFRLPGLVGELGEPARARAADRHIG